MFHLIHSIIRLIFILCNFTRLAILSLVFSLILSTNSFSEQPEWVLSGTFLDSSNAHAMFVDKGGDELLLELGDNIQGCTLLGVLNDSAKLLCNNKEYILYLRNSVGDLILQAQYEEALENSKTIVLSKSELNDYVNQKQKLVSEIGFLPVLEDEKVTGFALSKIRPDTQAASLGLFNGDVIKVVNNVPASDPDFIQRIQELSDAPEVTIQIDRNGRLMAYTYILD
jgi:type II secretory pathway component PulC